MNLACISNLPQISIDTFSFDLSFLVGEYHQGLHRSDKSPQIQRLLTECESV